MNDTLERVDLSTKINKIEYTLKEVNDRQQREIIKGLALMPESITEKIYNNYYLTGHDLTIRQIGIKEYGVFNGIPQPLYVIRGY